MSVGKVCEVFDLLAQIANNLNDMPISEAWAAKTALRIEAMIDSGVDTAASELVAALTAERAIRSAECKPPIDVELAAFARTDAALARVQS